MFHSCTLFKVQGVHIQRTTTAGRTHGSNVAHHYGFPLPPPLHQLRPCKWTGRLEALTRHGAQWPVPRRLACVLQVRHPLERKGVGQKLSQSRLILMMRVCDYIASIRCTIDIWHFLTPASRIKGSSFLPEDRRRRRKEVLINSFLLSWATLLQMPRRRSRRR